MCCTSVITTYTPYVTMIGGAILGASCAYFFGVKLSQRAHANAIDLMQRQEFNRSATDFLCAFTDVIGIVSDLEAGREGSDIDMILLNSYTLHRNALLRFKTYLSETERIAIEKEWKNYCYGEIIPGELEPEKFDQYKVDVGQFEEAKQLALANINRLLAFAK